MTKMHLKALALSAMAGLGLWIGACQNTPQPTPTLPVPTATITSLPIEPDPTPELPTATPEPLAAVVNGEAVFLSEYQEEMLRFQDALASASGMNLATTQSMDPALVIQELINQVLLAQAAAQSGYSLGEAELQARIDQLAAQSDLPAWLQINHYTESSFRLSLARSVQAAWMRDQILAGLPDAVEQVHARQILLYNSEDANQVLASLQNGQDFARLAAVYDPVTGGDLGWFPRGYLLESAVEDAAFNLQPEQFSAVIETRLGFHIIQVLERQPDRLLEPDARRALQEQALEAWLADRREQSEIQVFVP
jgi:parvulin-like peptidyl-prolyl isomerase